MMAISGLHNVSAIDSAFLRDSQSAVVRSRDDEGRSGNRASSILQMWRELDDGHMVGQSSPGRERILQHRDDGLGVDFSRLSVSDSHSVGHSVNSEDMNAEYREWSPSLSGSEIGQDDSSDLCEEERERVRQVFREWMTNGTRERPPVVRGRGHVPKAEWLGETEQERVRIIREWVQTNSRQRGDHVDRRWEHDAEVVGQIEKVLDGQLVNNNEGRSEISRRGIRRLCGRQALLDMVKKAERERKSEIQGLLELHAVTQFAHRNRIQSILRGRFLRNDRVIEGERHASRTASELGLLIQRHTVSDLRIGFSSKVDHSLSSQVGGSSSNESSDSSSNTDTNGNGSDHQNIHGAQSNLNDTECCGSWVSDGRTGIEDADPQGSADSSYEMSVNISEGQGRDRQQAAGTDSAERRNERHEQVELNSEVQHDGSSTESSENGEPTLLLSDREARLQQNQINLEGSATPCLLVEVEGSLGTATESFHEPVVQMEQLRYDALELGSGDLAMDSFESFELVGNDTEHVGYSGDSLPSTEQFENRDVSGGDQHGTTSSEWFENENTEEATEVWHDDGSFQEAVQSWLEPNYQDDVPIRRMDPFYLPDNDNEHSSELMELLNRRSVSTLLRSGFRQSLDQLLQSYVQRQSHASPDMEMQETPPSPSSGEQDPLGPIDQTEDQGDAQQSPPFVLPFPSLPPSQQLWDRESHHYAWPHSDMHPQFGIEWDIINDLRIDMARLQQQMNNMQRMLEACMDMQLEMQRSIRQEVSAALNRSASKSGTSETIPPEDKSKLDGVRKGLCCMCRGCEIDSLLYRCGHMCTCAKCANELFLSGGKCPMCWAPVIEVIRAYSIL